MLLRKTERIQDKTTAKLDVRFQQYSDESDALFSLFSEGYFPPELEDVQFFIPIDRRCFQRRNEAPVPRFAC